MITTLYDGTLQTDPRADVLPLTLDFGNADAVRAPKTSSDLLAAGYAVPEEERKRKLQRRQASWLAKIDDAALNPDSFFAKHPIDPTFVEDMPAEQRATINQAFTDLSWGDRPKPPGPMGREIMRRQLAFELFNGKGSESEDAFHAEIVKAAQGRKDVKALGEYLGQRGAAEAVVGIGAPEREQSWQEVLANVRKMPGYDPSKDADYLERYHDVRQRMTDDVAPFAPQLDQIWAAMRTGGAGTASEIGRKAIAAGLASGIDPVAAGKSAVGAVQEIGKEDSAAMAYRMYKDIAPEDRPKFMDALALLAKRLPKEQQPGFWSNMVKEGGRAVDDLPRQAGEAAWSMLLKYPAQDDPSGTGKGAPIVDPDVQERAVADNLARRNFAIDVRKISREDYDPMKSAFGNADIGWKERAAYAFPGLLAFTGEASIPVVGTPAMLLSMQGQAYEGMRDRLRAGGMDDAKASSLADGVAPLVAIPQAVAMHLVSGQMVGKLPVLNKWISGLSDQIENRAIRFGVKAAGGVAGGTAAMDAMAIMPPVVQDALHALNRDVPDVDWKQEFGAILKATPETFLTMLPLSLHAALGGINAEARNRAFASASDLELAAMGVHADDVPKLRDAAAKGDATLGRVLPSILKNRNPDSPEAKAAVEQLNTVLVEQRTATERLAQLGYAIPKYTANTDGTFTVADGRTGEEIGRANDLQGVERLSRAHTAALDDMSTDEMWRLGTYLEGAQKSAQATGIEKQIDLGKIFNRDAVEAMGPKFVERYAEEKKLIEQANGGTGEVSMDVLGRTDSEVRNGVKTLVSKLYGNSDLATMFEEDFHNLRARAHDNGTISRDEEIRVLRSADTVLAGRKNRAGEEMRFLPEGIKDEDISETRLDEGIAALFTMYGGFRFAGRKPVDVNALGVPRHVVAAHIGAMSRLEAGPVGKMKAFFDAVKARWGLALSRLYMLKKAEKAGEFDPKHLDAYMDKLFGTDRQKEHDIRVAAEADKIIPAEDRLSLALGRGKSWEKLFTPEELAKLEKEKNAILTNRAIGFEESHAAVKKNFTAAFTKALKRAGPDAPVFPHDMPVDVRREILKWDTISKSPYSASFYNSDDKSWDYTRPGSLRIADHWNFEDQKGEIHAHTDKPVANDSWAMGRYEDGQYKILKEWKQTSPAQSAEAGRKMDESRASSVSGSESRQSLDPNEADSATIASEFSLALGPAKIADVLAGDALSRIRDPRRRAQAMSRIARNFDELKVSTERALLLSTARTGKAELKWQANLQEEMLADQYVGEAYARHQGVLSDADLTRIKSQPGHELLANPDTPLRGRLMSKRQAIAMHPDMFIKNRPGEYDGADGVSRSVFGGTLMPDQAAQELYAAHLIKEPTADAMWALLKQEQAHVAKMKDALTTAQDDVRAAKLRAKEEANQWLAERTGDQAANFSQKDEILRSLASMDAILSALPPDIAGRIGGHTQMARISGDETRLNYLQDKLAKADTELGNYLKRAFGKEFNDLLKSSRPQKDNPGERPKGTIGADTHDIFKAIENEYMGMTAKQVEARIVEIEHQLAAENITPEQQAKLEKMLEMVTLTGNWNAASASRREQALAAAQSLHDAGYMARVIELSHQREQIAKGRENLISATGKGGTAAERDQREAEEMGWKAGLSKKLFSLRSFEQAIHRVFGETSDLGNRLVDAERHAAHAKSDAIHKKASDLEDLFTSMGGGSVVKGRQIQWDMHQKALEIEGRKLSQTEAITVTLLWRQEDGRRHMMGHLDDAGNPVGEWHYGHEFVDKVEAALTPEARQVRQHLIDEYSSEYPRINEVFRKLEGLNLPSNAFYSPITVKPAAEGRAAEVDAGIGGTGSLLSPSPGALKNRSQTAIAEPDFRDAIGVFLTHTRQMEHYIAYGEFCKEFNGLVGSRAVMNAVEATAGKQGRIGIRDWATYFTEGGNRDAGAYMEFNKWLGRMSSRAASSILIGKASVIAVQTNTLAGAWYEMPTGAYVGRLAKLLTGNLGWGDAVKSPYMQRRLKEMPVLVRLAMESLQSSKPGKIKYAIEKLGNLINGTDALFSAGSYAIIYDYQLGRAKEMGIANPEAFAHEAAERGVDRISQPTRPGTRSLWENRSTSLIKFAWVFGSEARQKVALAAFTTANPEAGAGRKVRALAVTFLAQGLLSTLMRQTLRQAQGTDKTDMADPETWDWKHLVLASVFSPFSGLPILGDIIQGTGTAAFGGGTPPQGNILSGTIMMAKALSHIDETVKGERDTRETIKDVDDILSGMAVTSDMMAEASSIAHLAKFIYGVGDNIHEHAK